MPAWLSEWWPIISFVLSGVLALLATWIAWSARKQFVTNDQFSDYRETHNQAHDDIERQLAKGASEFAVIKAELEHLPTQQEIEKAIALAVAPLQVGIDAVKESAGGIQNSIQLLLNHELAEARDAKKAGK